VQNLNMVGCPGKWLSDQSWWCSTNV